MGMYTELVIKAVVSDECPADVRTMLDFLFNRPDDTMADFPPVLLDHPFFECPRWTLIGIGSSYYHVPWSTSRFNKDYIFSRSDLKNYDSEIALFIDWVSPYLLGRCIGWMWYEEDEEPTLIMRNDEKDIE